MYKVTHLRCNDTRDVIGIDAPVFSWWLESDKRFVKQIRFQIQTALDADFKEVIWNYLRYTDDTSGIRYSGPQLKSRTRYYTRVRVWVSDDILTEWSETIFWETPIMDQSEWNAQWIMPETVEKYLDKQYRRPFIAEKEFCLSGKIQKARLYITSLGIYTADLNGKKVSDDYFRPGFTDYNHRLQFQSYDVSNFLKDKNVLKVTVSEGWFSGYFGCGWEDRKDTFGNNNALLAQLEVTYENGAKEILGTDGTWKQKYGEIVYSDFYNGELYDCREKEHYCGQMKEFDYPKTTLIPQEGPSVKKVKELKPVKVFKDTDGQTVLDMGQNMVGWIRFRNMNATGEKIVLSHGEVLDKDGRFYNENLRGAISEDVYILNKNDGKYYEPHFTYHGFRYVRLQGFTYNVCADDFRGIVLSSDMECTGKFKTGNERINQLQSNIVWGQRGNFVDIPTDCPQRDERQGWTADAQIILPTASFNFNTDHFFRKWLKDLYCGQMEQEGAVPYVVPDVLKGVFSAGKSFTTAGWGDAAVICPWVLYETYGDEEVLRDQYDSMTAWIDYIRREGDNEYLWDTGVQLGDWLALDSKEDNYYGATDGYLVATAYYGYSVKLLANTAKILGKMSDYREYKELYKNIRREFYKNFVKENMELISDTQTAYILVLQFGLLEKKDEKAAVEHLVKLLHKNDDHLNTGFLGTPYICQVLTDHGCSELAYKLLFNSDFPSWLYQVDHGATTMWEHWDGQKEDGSFWSADMNSFNHYAYGSIGNWMYQTIGGIQMKEPGYKKIVFAPRPDVRIGRSECELLSAHGPVRCRWEIVKNEFIMSVFIPANTCALVMLPEPENEEELCRQINAVTDGTAVYAKDNVSVLTGILFEGEYKIARSFTERKIIPDKQTAFEVGSGEFEFRYRLKNKESEV